MFEGTLAGMNMEHHRSKSDLRISTLISVYSISGTSPETNKVVGGPYSPISGFASRLQATTPTWLSASARAVRIARSSLC
jgi:hypothetical protein